MFLVLAGSSTPIESRSFSCLKVAMDITFNVFEYSADRGDSFGLGDVILCEKVDDFVFHDHHHVMIECAFVETAVFVDMKNTIRHDALLKLPSLARSPGLTEYGCLPRSGLKCLTCGKELAVDQVL